LGNAVFHLYEGRYRDCINRAFGIVENNTSIKGYCKFNCIRNVLIHEKLEQHVTDAFTRHFGPNLYGAFGFEKYDPKNGIINVNFESKKSRKTLNDVATDLIDECKRILSL